MLPLIAIGEVLAQYPDTGQLQIMLRTTGAVPTVPVLVGYHGYADAIRISQRPLPSRGTWGVIAFPNGDPRNGVWLMSYYPNRADAITGSTAATSGVPQDAFLDYESMWSGFFSLLDPLGQFACEFPDGTFATLSSGASGLPTIYRHTVDDSGNRMKVPVMLSDRVSSGVAPKNPFQFTFAFNSGALIQVNTSGSIVLSAASGQSFTAIASGGGSLVLDASGNITATAASGAMLTAQVSGHGALVIDNAGNIDAVLGTGGVFNIYASGGSASQQLVLYNELLSTLQSLQTAYSNHEHTLTGFMAGGAAKDTGPPTDSWDLETNFNAIHIAIDE